MIDLIYDTIRMAKLKKYLAEEEKEEDMYIPLGTDTSLNGSIIEDFGMTTEEYTNIERLIPF